MEEHPDLKNLILRLMDVNPDTRLTLARAMEHEWVTEEGSNPLEGGKFQEVELSQNEVSTALGSAKSAESVLDELSTHTASTRTLQRNKRNKNAPGLAPLKEQGSWVGCWRLCACACACACLVAEPWTHRGTPPRLCSQEKAGASL